MANRIRDPRSRITARDRALLEFVAAHRFVFAAHAKVFLDASASVTFARLRALERHGLLLHDRLLHEYPRHYQATRAGLGLIDSKLPPARTDAREFKHDVGVAWLWLAARGEAFGEVEQVIAERALRSRDARRVAGEEPLAVRLGGQGPGGRDRLHYPDLLLVGRDGRRTALELELTAKSRTRRETILTGYAIDNRIERVLYLVESDAIGRAVGATVRKLGISGLVAVRRVQVTDCRQSLASGRVQADGRVQPGARVQAGGRVQADGRVQPGARVQAGERVQAGGRVKAGRARAAEAVM